MTTKVRLFALCTLALAACTPEPAKPLPPPPPARITSFTVSPDTVARAGDAVTLSWAATDATSVSIEQLGVGPVAGATGASGTASAAVTRDTVFVLTARGEGGTDSASKAVRVTGSSEGVLFAALPPAIVGGESTSLVWSAPGAKVVTLAEVGGAAIDTRGQIESGSVAVSPVRTTSYRLTADGRDVTAEVVVRPIIDTFELVGAAPRAGEMLTLRWTTRGGSSLTLTREGATSTLLTENDAAKVASGTFSEAVPAGVGTDGALRYHLALTSGTSTVEGVVTVRVGGGVTLTVTAPRYAQANTQAIVRWTTTNASSLELRVAGATQFVAASQAEVNASNFQVAVPATGTLQVEVIARNGRGDERRSTSPIEVVGPIQFNTFTADKTTIAAGGEKVTLSWNVTNARRVRIREVGGRFTKEVTGNVDTGMVSVYPNRATTTYELSADNQTTQPAITPQTLSVTVTSPATLTFSRQAPPGAPVEITGSTIADGGTLLDPDFLVPGPDAFIDISTTGNPTPEFSSSAEEVYDLGAWTIPLGGTQVDASKVNISPNGWFAFRDTTFNASNSDFTTFGTNLPPLAIAPLERNWQENFSDATSDTYWQLDMTAQGKRLIVQWQGMQLEAATSSIATFQAQVYSDGRIVFAYRSFTNLSPVTGLIGVNSTPPTTQLGAPTASSSLTYSPGQALPVPLTIAVPNRTISVLQQMSDGVIELVGDARLTPELFRISEVHPRPSVVNGEWVEVSSTSAAPYDLSGWVLDFGGGSTFTIPMGTVLPANGSLVFAQATDLGDPTAGVSASVVYPTSIAMNDTAGTVSIALAGGTYSSATWANTVAGTSVQVDGRVAGYAYATGRAGDQCNSAGATFGTQTGTPGTVGQPCFRYAMPQSITANFEPIASAMGVVRVLSTTADNVGATATLPAGQEVRLFGALRTSVFMCPNGFLATSSASCSSSEKSLPTTSTPIGTVAAFWDDLVGDGTATAGGYRLFKDPDATPNTGDEYTIFSWENWRVYGTANPGTMNFQLKIFANGNIEVHYGNIASSSMPANPRYVGSSATAWIESLTGLAAAPISIQSTTPGIQPNTAFRWNAL